MKAVIILPTYNEKGNIDRLIPLLEEEVFPGIKNYHMAILVVDDSSPDGTAEIVRGFIKKWKNIELLSGEKNGLGAAYVRGMTYAIEKMDADVVFEMDADLSHDPKHIPDFLEKIDKGYDMVISTRYSNGGSIPKDWGFERKAFSVLGNLIVRMILMRFAVHDWTGGYRALKKEVFLKIRDELHSVKGYTFQVAFLLKAAQNHFKITELPIDFTDRTHGKSKIASGEYIYDLLRYVISARIIELKRFIKFLIVGGTGFITQILVQEVTIRSGFSYTLAILLGVVIDLFMNHQDTSSLSEAVGVALGAEAAILSNFLYNNFWTFKDTRKLKTKSPFIIRLMKFNSASLASIFLQTFSAWLGIKILGSTIQILSLTIPTRILIVIPTIILIVIPLNYLIYNRFIWKTHHLKHEGITPI
jgi:dolichol-phosphate mannosyltransferase